MSSDEEDHPGITEDPEDNEDRADDGGSFSFRRVKFAPSNVIFDEGQTDGSAYLIIKGKVEIRKGVRTKHPKVLGVVGRGEVIGEMALFDNCPHMACAVAVTPVIATEISKEEFRRRVSEMDPVVRSAVRIMTKRARQMAEMLIDDPKDVDWYKWKRSR